MERFLARIADRDTRRRIIDESQGDSAGWSRGTGSLGWDDILVASCRQQTQFEGCTMAQIADAMGKEPPEAMMDFLLVEQGRVAVVMFMMSEANVALGIAHPLLMIGSDSLALATGQGGKPHPRTYGTFPARAGQIRARRRHPQPRRRRSQDDLHGGGHLRPSATAACLPRARRRTLRSSMRRPLPIRPPSTRRTSIPPASMS